jgi:hypothetical protein
MFNQKIKTMKKGILIAAFCFASLSLATAQRSPGISNSQKHQTMRINQGVRSGELTRQETKRLVKEQKHVQHEKRLAKADGKVTRRERKHIRHDQRVANRDIYRQKHDNQDRN